jgi:hypothetical protein
MILLFSFPSAGITGVYHYIYMKFCEVYISISYIINRVGVQKE